VNLAHPACYLGTELDRRYRLDRLLGEGVSAWVFAARDLRLERDVAIKAFKPRVPDEQAQQRKRFLAEGRTLARLVHPHVVLVHDAGESADGLRYLVMELSDSGTLEGELYRRGSMPAAEALQLLLPVVGALACAHDRGILHRDIKPANIALVRERGEMQAKVLDFGIARRCDGGSSTDGAVGTPLYMAPEQARGGPLSPATDVWAVGVVFFRCLSGRVPFEGTTSSETLLKLTQGRAPLFSQVCPDLDPRLAIALDQALEPNPRRRYADMRSFAHALAIACAQARIRLPQRLEPVGLPELDRWIADADVENTRPLTGDEGGRPAPVVRPRSLRRWLAPALALVVVALLHMAISRAGSGKVTNEQPVVPLAAARERSDQAEKEAPAAVVASAPRESTVLAPSPPAALQPLGSRPPAKKRAPGSSRAALPAPPPPAGDDTSSTPTLGGKPPMIRTWEW
jgi:eukaryotic-like serine/threonine-protein kinase